MTAPHTQCQPEADGLRKVIAALQKANVPDRELDVAIVHALHPNIGPYQPHCQGDEPIFWHDPYRKQSCPKFTASIDAAMTLIPDANEWLIRNGKRADGDSRPFAHVWKLGENQGSEGISPEPAIALCLAALRARAVVLPLEDRK